MKKVISKNTVVLGISVALAMVLSYVEFLLPPIYAPLPAVKCGLANVVVVFALYRMGFKGACAVAVMKVILTALLFGSFVSLAYSGVGAILSLAVMVLLRRIGSFSSVGVSIAGGVAHNAGQILVAILMLKSIEIVYYFPILVVSGTIAGIVVGLCGGIAVKRVK